MVKRPPTSPFPARIAIPDNTWDGAWRQRAVEHVREIARAGLVVVLQRAGALAFSVVRGCAAARGIALPPVIEVLIGREISYTFEERCHRSLSDFYWRVKDDTPLPLQVPGHEEVDAYYAWLERASRWRRWQVSRTIDRLTSLGAGLGDVHDITIVDDFAYQGPTLYMTAPFIVRKVWPAARLRALAFFGDGWLHKIVAANFPETDAFGRPQADAEAALLRSLAKGFDDARNRLEPIGAANLMRLGARIVPCCTYQRAGRPRNPAKTLSARYGLPSLLRLHDMTAAALEAYGRGLGEANGLPL